MSISCGYHSLCTTTSTSRHPRLLSPHPPSNFTTTKLTSTSTQFNLTTFNIRLISSTLTAAAAAKNNTNPNESKNKNKDDEVEEEDLPWIQEKALDIVEFSGSVTQALPGPRVGQSSFPWILAVPVAYVGVSFVIAFVKTVRKFTSPKQARCRLVSKNAELCRSIDELLDKEQNEVHQGVLKELMQKTGFSMVEILRKYIRYALNEKPFDPKLIASLIQLRKATMLDDSEVAEMLNEISRRIVKDFGPVVMNTSGYSEKGLRRKLAVQALFGKILYLSELPEFCARDSSLIVKEIFGVADEDVERLRLPTVAEAGDMDSLEKMVVSVDADEDEDLEDSGEDA
ncbi:uncharacterized protein LOC143547491 [Bidens hawaiensis]|uniref:uncharacterized protein LOC143547491 n=1 Tax=Bidens hawaiensis TaxID=980011 RepID=UPI00404ADCA0